MRRVWSVAELLTANIVFGSMAQRARTKYLSFDEGPYSERRLTLLDLPQAHHVRATYSIVGHLARRQPELVRRNVDEGRAGNYSTTHVRVPRLTVRAQIAESKAADGAKQSFNGRRQRLFQRSNGRATVATILDSVLRRPQLIAGTRDNRYCDIDAAPVDSRLVQAALHGGNTLLCHEEDDGAAGAALARLPPHWQGARLLFTAT